MYILGLCVMCNKEIRCHNETPDKEVVVNFHDEVDTTKFCKGSALPPSAITYVDAEKA